MLVTPNLVKFMPKELGLMVEFETEKKPDVNIENELELLV